MTQKELLYLEDAIGHEKNIIEICKDIKDNLEDDNLVSFMEKEIEEHTTTESNLLNILEVKSNE